MRRRKEKFFTGILVLCMLMQLVWPGIPHVKAQGVQTAVINPVDFGADPTGARDSTRAIWDAFEAAKKAVQDGAESVVVSFPKGEYHIYKDYAQKREYHTSNTNSTQSPEKTIGLLIEDQENFTLDGNGSLFMMHGNMMALAVVRSRNITLQDFSWDFAVPTVSEMTVTGMGSTQEGKDYTDFYIPKCFPYEISSTTIKWYSEKSPYTGEYYWTKTGIHENSYSVVAYHPDEEMTRAYYTSDSPFEGVAEIQSLGDTKVRMIYRSTRPSMQKEGMVFQFTSSAYRETAGAFTWESENVTARRVNVHFMHGFGWLIQMSTDVYYYECNLVPRENSGHITVSYADGIHASGAAGDLVIEDCSFANTHDDPINLHGTFTRVEQRVDDHTLVLKYIHGQQGGFPQFHEGDQVAFFTRDTLESTDHETLYTVEKVISNPGENGNDLRTMRIRFVQQLPENLSDQLGAEPKYVAENVTFAPRVQIRNCTFKNVTTRGILCTTRNKVVIEGNTFLNMSMASIYLSNDSDEWYESGPIRDMTIRDNVFYIKDIGRTSWAYACPIYIHPVTKGGGLPSEDNPIHKNITIEENTFYMDMEEKNPRGDDVDAVVRAESVENLTIRKNKILRRDPGVTIHLTAEKTSLSSAEKVSLTAEASGLSHTKAVDHLYEFHKCKNVILEDNTYDDGFKRYAVISGMSASNLINRDEEITVKTASDNVMFEAVKGVVYASSNPEVASVDAAGNLTAHKKGTASVYAYYEWNGTRILSNQIKITVDQDLSVTDWEIPEENDTQVDEISVEGLNFKESLPKAGSWLLNADSTQGELELKITGNDRIGQVKILEGYVRTEMACKKNGNRYEVPLKLQNGLNSYYIQVTAKDGITQRQYILNINYDAPREADPKMISINGVPLTGFEAGKDRYLLTLAEGSRSVSVEVDEGDAAEVRIAVNGEMTEEHTAAVLKDGANDIQIVTVARDGISRKSYNIQAVKPCDTNAEIYDIKVNGKSVAGRFENDRPMVPVSEEDVEVEVTALDERAVIRISNNWCACYGKGSAKKKIRLYKEYPDIRISVSSVDGTAVTEKTLNFEKSEYLSDLSYEIGSTVGYGSVMMNKAPEGTAIRLTDAQGQVITYEKGIGAHADSEIVYDLSGEDYQKLSGYAGVDYIKYASEYANIKFTILGDGKTLFESETMRGNTPQAAFELDLSGISRLVLKATQAENDNWDAHAVWADMKLSKALPAVPEKLPDVSRLESALEEALRVQPKGKTEAEIKEFKGMTDAVIEILDRLMRGDDPVTQAQAEEMALALEQKTEDMKKEPEKEPEKQPEKIPDHQEEYPILPVPSSRVRKGDTVRYKDVIYQVLDVEKKTAAAKGAKKTAARVVIPGTVKIKGVAFRVVQIQKNAFKNWKNLKAVTIGENVTEIGKQSFYGCTKLKQVIFKGASVRKVQSAAFAKTGKKIQVKLPKKGNSAKKKKLLKLLTKAGMKKR